MPRPDPTEELLEAFLSQDLAAIHALAEAGVDIDGRDADGRTVLMCAAAAGEETAVRWILDAGAALEARGADGETALLLAVRHRRRAVVERLLAAGARADVRDAEDDEIRRLLAAHGAAASAPPRAPRWQRARGLGDRRGVGRMLLIEAAPQRVALAFVRHTRAETWLRHAWGKKGLAAGGYLVLRLHGQRWTMIRHLGDRAVGGRLREEDARALSATLAVSAIFLDHRGEDAAVSCSFFAMGEKQEWIADGEADDYAAADPAAAIELLERDLAPMRCGSRLRELPEIDDPVRFVDRLLRRQGAYAPRIGVGGGVLLEIPGLAPEDLERLDYVAL